MNNTAKFFDVTVLVILGNGLMRKQRLILKLMTSLTGDPIIKIHNCPMLQEVKLADNEIWSVNRIYYEEYFS